jgi:hypothetical protein
MEIIDKNLLDTVSAAAKSSERLRMNHNFHETLEAPCQRMLNALEPGTFVPIHRHIHTAETYILLRGKLKIFFYNEEKVIIEEEILDQSHGCYGVHIPAGVWHSMEVLESGTIIFETKDGPYTPITEQDILK